MLAVYQELSGTGAFRERTIRKEARKEFLAPQTTRLIPGPTRLIVAPVFQAQSRKVLV